MGPHEETESQVMCVKSRNNLKEPETARTASNAREAFHMTTLDITRRISG